MKTTINSKISKLKARFENCSTPQSKYLKIIEIGREVTPLPENEKCDSNRVEGCQSRMYLSASCSDGVMIFHADSDALISNGLAACLLSVYNAESPEVVLKFPPDFLQELDISTSISPNRANGLYSLHLMLKQRALQALIEVK